MCRAIWSSRDWRGELVAVRPHEKAKEKLRG